MGFHKFIFRKKNKSKEFFDALSLFAIILIIFDKCLGLRKKEKYDHIDIKSYEDNFTSITRW